MPLSARPFWLLAAVALALLALPLYLVDVVPLLDYPAHLARVTLLANQPLDPLVARAYSVDVRPLANLAMDIAVPVLAPLTGATLGLKLFITTGLGLWIVGAALLYRGLWREWSLQPLAATFFALNPTFFDGYFNFHFAAGLALTGAGLWLLCRHGVVFLAGMAALAVALLFSHLMAVAILGLILGSLEVGREVEHGLEPRRLALNLAKVALVFVPAALLWLFVLERGPGGPIEYRWLGNLLGLGIYSSQFAGVRFNAAPIVLLFVALFFAWRTRRLRLARRALPALALTYLAALVMPSDALGGAGIHIRLPAIVGVIAVVAARVDLTGVRRRTVAAALVVVLALGSAVQSVRWIADAATIERVRTAWRAHVPEGARVAAALASERDDVFWHVVDLAVVDRKASVAALFTTPGQSTLRLNPAYARFSATNAYDGGYLPFAIAARLVSATPPKLEDAESIRRFRPYADMACDFDYLLLMGARPPVVAVPTTLTAVAEDDRFTIFRITPPPGRPCQPR